MWRRVFWGRGLCSFIGEGFFLAGGNFSAETRSFLRNIISGCDRGKNCAQQREQKSAPLNYELLFGGESHSLVSHFAECALLLTQFTRVTTSQSDVTVQEIKDALAYAIHKFLVRVPDYRPTQFRFGRLEYVKGVIIRFHSLHHTSASARRLYSALSGIHSFKIAGDHQYLVTSLEVDIRGGV